MRSHLFLMVIFSACVATVFAGLMRENAREQVALGLRMFGAMIAAAIVLGWLMLPFPL